MSSNPPGVYSKLVGNCPLNAQSANNTISNDQKSLSAGIMNHGASTMRPTSQKTNQPSSSNSINEKPKGNLCSSCAKPVYFAEEVRAAGQLFHKQCYKCTNCKKSISGGNFSEHDGNIYDNNCYQRLFGPKGVGFGIGAGALSTGN